MANIAELQASIKLNTQQFEQKIKETNKSIAELNKKFIENGVLTKEEQKNFNELNKEFTKNTNSLNKLNKANDNFIKTGTGLNKLIIENLKATNQLNASQEKSSGIWSKLATRITMAGLAVQAITGMFNNLVQSIRQTSSEAVDFEKNMSLVNTVFRMSKSDLDDYSKKVTELGTKLGKDPKQLAMGLYELSQAGIEAKDGMSTLELATKASVAGFTDVQTAVKSGIGMMNAYGLSTKDLNSIYDLQFKIVERGILSYEDLQEALGNTMSSAVQAKVPMNELGGQLAYLTKQGQNSSKASVALARAYESIYSKGDKFKQLGINVADTNGKLRSTTDILGEFAKVMAGYTEEAQFNIMQQLGFSERADRAIIAMMGNVQGVRDEILNVTNNTGQMASAFERAQDNIATAQAKGSARMIEELNKLRINNEKTIIDMIKLWTDLKITILETVQNIVRFGKYIYELPIKWTEPIKWWKEVFSTKPVEDLENSIKNTGFEQTLKISSTGFKDWAGSIKDYFQNVMDNSSTMSVEVAKNMLAMLKSYEMVSKKMGVNQFSSGVRKQMRMEGYTEDQINEALKPVKSSTNISGDIKFLEDYIKNSGGTKLKTVAPDLSPKNSTRNNSSTKIIENPQNLELEAGFNKAQEDLKNYFQRKKEQEEELAKLYEESSKKLDDKLSKEKELENNRQKDITSIFSTLGNATTLQEAKKAYEELYGQYYNNAEIIAKLNEIYPLFTKNLNNNIENLNATADLFGELGNVLENDFLNSMANTINGITSIMNTMKSINAGSIGGFAGGLGIATAAIGILSPIVSTWFGNSDSENKRNEASQKFEEAVNKFQQAVDSMSLGQKISFAKLTKPTNLMAGGIGSSGANGILGGLGLGWGASNASIDTTAIQNALNGGGYSGIDVQSIFKKYAQYSSYYDASDWFKKKSYISGYDTAGAMAEINRLIEEAYQKNLENFKEALSLTTSSFASALSSALDGGDVESILTDMFNNAMKTAFLNQEMFESVYKAIGTSMSDLVLQAMGGKGKTADELKNMSLTDLVAYLKEMMSTWTDVQKKAFEEAGLSLDNLTKAVDKTTSSMSNLPSYVKTVQLENLATQGYNVGGSKGTTIQIDTVYGSVDSQFINMVNKAVGYKNVTRTGN